MSARTKQREAIRDAVAAAGRPLTPAEIHALVSPQVESIGMATVYRTLKLLVDEGFIVPVEMPGEPPRYELEHPAAGHHHHHFRCDECQRVFDLEGCVSGLKGLLPSGFSMRDHEIFLFGTCAECAGAA